MTALQEEDTPAHAFRGAPASARLHRALHAAVVGLALLGFITCALTIAGRIGFPWPLEWMEGGIAQHAQRLALGLPLYGPPSANFVPYLYPPLGYAPMALFAALFGPGLPVLRASSVVGALLAALAVARIAGRVSFTGTSTSTGAARACGLLAAGMFALGFGYGGAFLDLVRIDAWFIALLAWGAERLICGRHRSGLWLLAASAFAKQHGLLLFLAAAAPILWHGRSTPRRALRDVGPPALGLCAGLLGLELSSAGWFSRYVFELPATHGLQPGLLLSFLLVDLCLLLPVLMLGAGRWLWAQRHQPASSPTALLLLAALLVSALGRAHPGGHDNVRLPALLLLCALGVPALAAHVLQRTAPRRTRLWALALLALQCVILWQPPAAHAPSARAESRHVELAAALERCADGGERIALDYAGLTPTPSLHTMALFDLRLGSTSAAPTPVTTDELAALGTAALLAHLRGPRAPAAVAVGGRLFAELDAVLAARYVACARLPAPPMATGYQPPAQHVHRRADLPQRPPLAP